MLMQEVLTPSFSKMDVRQTVPHILSRVQSSIVVGIGGSFPHVKRLLEPLPDPR